MGCLDACRAHRRSPTSMRACFSPRRGALAARRAETQRGAEGEKSSGGLGQKFAQTAISGKPRVRARVRIGRYGSLQNATVLPHRQGGGGVRRPANARPVVWQGQPPKKLVACPLTLCIAPNRHGRIIESDTDFATQSEFRNGALRGEANGPLVFPLQRSPQRPSGAARLSLRRSSATGATRPPHQPRTTTHTRTHTDHQTTS